MNDDEPWSLERGSPLHLHSSLDLRRRRRRRRTRSSLLILCASSFEDDEEDEEEDDEDDKEEDEEEDDDDDDDDDDTASDVTREPALPLAPSAAWIAAASDRRSPGAHDQQP